MRDIQKIAFISCNYPDNAPNTFAAKVPEDLLTFPGKEYEIYINGHLRYAICISETFMTDAKSANIIFSRFNFGIRVGIISESHPYLHTHE